MSPIYASYFRGRGRVYWLVGTKNMAGDEAGVRQSV